LRFFKNEHMALIGTLRNKMGTWVVVFVFVAIASFVLGDLLGNNSVLLNDNSVGEIAGNSISLQEYQQAIQERESNFFLNTNRQPTDRDMPAIRQQAWDMLIARYGIQKEISKAGITVSIDEIEDMITGKNVDPNVSQAFTNPQTGQFDRQQVVSYLQQLNSMPETSEPRIRWEIFQRDLKPGRERLKYENLLIKSAYITTAEAELDYHLQSDVAEVSYLFVPYLSVTDKVTPTDADFKAYYNKNKERYKTEHMRDLKYVQFQEIPSSADTLAIKEEMERLAADFKTAIDDSTFALVNSDKRDAFTKYNASSLPAFITVEELVKGAVKGPFIDGDAYKIVKVTEVGKDTVFAARASHILIRWSAETNVAKNEAKEKARGILKEIKAGASFEEKAREHGTDGTASQGGDLGWFTSDQMVKPFESAVFAASKAGLLNDVVETDFGYHIISVTNVKENNFYKLAVIERAISPSDATINETQRKAETFASDLSGVNEFTARAEQEGLTVLEAKNIGTAERRLTGLGESRQVVQWLFRNAEKGKVSDAFNLDGTYVVAVMTAEVEKGYKSLELVKEEITPAVENELKSKLIIEKLNKLSGSLAEIASAYGQEAIVQNMSDLKLGSNTLGSVGFDAKAVGIAFSLESGKRSKPYAGERGVLIVEMQNKTIAPAIADYSANKMRLEQIAQNKNTMNISEAIKEKANIVDNRYKFY
jgi:peptidyl-prolyl cis-trans isomerase D